MRSESWVTPLLLSLMVRVCSPNAAGNGSPTPGIFQGMFCLKLCNKLWAAGDSDDVGIPEVEGNPAAPIPFPGRIRLFSAGSGVSLITSGRSSPLSSLENKIKNFFVKLIYLNV